MAVVLDLVPSKRDLETGRVLRELLADWEQGKLSGLAVVVRYRGPEYAGYLTGSAKDNPPLTRGMLDELKQEL